MFAVSECVAVATDSRLVGGGGEITHNMTGNGRAQSRRKHLIQIKSRIKASDFCMFSYLFVACVFLLNKLR